MTRLAAPATRTVATAYLQTMKDLLRLIDVDAIERVVQRLREARERRTTIFVAGNGGSAATAAHFVNDLGKAAKRTGCTPIRAMSLSDNTPWLTALANDEGYDRAFAGQMENFAEPGDVLIVISASGNSPNLVRATELARAREMTAIGFLGFDGGVLKDMVDDRIWIPTERGAYGPVEDCHAILCHTITACLTADGMATEERTAAW
ncbi:MAG: D-sedoheptulose-7-phosphate isomerase [Dehalococcoidia bacterium]